MVDHEAAGVLRMIEKAVSGLRASNSAAEAHAPTSPRDVQRRAGGPSPRLVAATGYTSIAGARVDVLLHGLRAASSSAPSGAQAPSGRAAFTPARGGQGSARFRRAGAIAR